MTSSRLRVAVLAIAASLLVGCATAPSDGLPCPPVVAYSRDLLARAADELASLSAGSAIEQMLADYQVMRDQVRHASASASERRLGPFGTPPLRRKAALAAVSTTWKQSRAETAGTTVNVGNLAIAVLQLEATPPAARRRYMAVAGRRQRRAAVRFSWSFRTGGGISHPNESQ